MDRGQKISLSCEEKRDIFQKISDLFDEASPEFFKKLEDRNAINEDKNKAKDLDDE